MKTDADRLRETIEAIAEIPTDFTVGSDENMVRVRNAARTALHLFDEIFTKPAPRPIAFGPTGLDAVAFTAWVRAGRPPNFTLDEDATVTPACYWCGRFISVDDNGVWRHADGTESDHGELIPPSNGTTK